jgi:hypothetical protein
MAGGGYAVEASFCLNTTGPDKALAELILKLEAADKALTMATTGFFDLGATAAKATMAMAAFNGEMGLTTGGLYRLASGAGFAAQAMAAMSRAAGGSGASRSLGSLNRQLTAIQTNATAAQRSMTSMAMTMPWSHGQGMGGRGGGAGGGGGGGMMMPSAGGVGNWINKSFMAMIGFDIAKAAMHPAMEYQQQQQGLESMGLSRGEMSRAEREAADMQRSMPATNRTENLKTIKELYGIFRKFPEAIELAPDFAKFNVALQGVGNRVPSLKGHEQEFAQSVAKSAESMGRLGRPEFRDFLNKSLQSYEATGGLVTPLHTAQAIKFSRGARYGKSDDWTFGVLSFLLEESALGKGGGGSRGVGPLVTQLDRTFAQGKMDKRLMAGLASLGLFEGSKPGGDASKHGLFTTTMDTGVTGKLKGMDKMIENPFEWVTKVFEPAMLKKEYKGMNATQAEAAFYKQTQAQQKAMIQSNAPGLQQQAGDAFYQFIINKKQIELFVANLKKAASVEESYNRVMESTAMKAQAAGQSLYLLAMQLGSLAGPIVGSALDGLRSIVNAFTDMDKTYPLLTAAFAKLNNETFGTGGNLEHIAKAMRKIYDNSGPFIHLLDTVGAYFLEQQSKDSGHAAHGAGRGAQVALDAQRKTGGLLPAAATGIPFMVAGAIEEVSRSKGREATKGYKQSFDAGAKVREYAFANAQKHFSKEIKTGQQVYHALHLDQKVTPNQIIINFNGAVTNISQIVDAVKQGISGAMARQAMGWAATTTRASSPWTNGPTQGVKP